MQYPGYTCQQRRANWAVSDSQVRHLESVGSSDIQLRNYDRLYGYDIDLELRDSEGDTVFEERYFLQPGEIERSLDVVPSGEYEIRVTLDNSQQESLHCRLDADPMNTAVIEVGNGFMSVTAGFTG